MEEEVIPFESFIERLEIILVPRITELLDEVIKWEHLEDQRPLINSEIYEYRKAEKLLAINEQWFKLLGLNLVQ